VITGSGMGTILWLVTAANRVEAAIGPPGSAPCNTKKPEQNWLRRKRTACVRCEVAPIIGYCSNFEPSLKRITLGMKAKVNLLVSALSPLMAFWAL
jgi:hypothetical protein